MKKGSTMYIKVDDIERSDLRDYTVVLIKHNTGMSGCVTFASPDDIPADKLKDTVGEILDQLIKRVNPKPFIVDL